MPFYSLFYFSFFMKSALFLASALLALSLRAAAADAPVLALEVAALPQDTITVRLPNKVVMTLLVRDAAQLRQLKNYHLDSLTSRLGTYITQAEAAAKTSKSERVTMEFYPDKDQPGQNLPEQVRITTHRGQPNTNKMLVVLGRKLNVEINMDEDGDKKITSRRTNGEPRRDSVREANGNRSHFSDFRLDVGLNAFVNKHAYTTGAGLPAGRLELRPEGSRYVNIGMAYSQRLGGKRSPFYLSLGPEFAFNNYMLQGNNRWKNENGRTEVEGKTSSEQRELQKSKLTTTTINVPLMLTMKLRNAKGRTAFQLGAGGFAGYLLGQHSKIKYYQDGDSHKEKDRGSFNLNEFQYGVQGTVGLGGLMLFAKYNLNELFKDNRGPQTQVLSFGLTLSGI